jgi:AcrR family transcriptional regulator
MIFCIQLCTMATAKRSRARGAREEAKEKTRNALLDGALKLLSKHSFDSISLREVTRKAGITPTAFYRHFDGMEELGLVLVEASFGTLHDMVREVRADMAAYEHIIARSVEVVVRHVSEHKSHMRFIARERHGGVRRLRRAIRVELEMFANELAADIGRLPGLDVWNRGDRQMLADLMVDTVVTTVGALLDARPEEEKRIAVRLEKQMRLIAVGVPGWRSRPDS